MVNKIAPLNFKVPDLSIPTMPKIKTVDPTVKTKNFIADVTSSIHKDPAKQAQSAIYNASPVGQDSPTSQQLAFQGKLSELNDWSKNITLTQRAGQRAKESAYQIKKYGTANYGSTGAVIGGSSGYSGNRSYAGQYQNGRIPSSALTGVSFAKGHALRSDAASALEEMNAAFRQQFGRNLSITDSYRSYDRQVLLKQQKGRYAATPGTSVHGLGLALDLGGGVNRAGSVENIWLNKYGSQYGWVNPAWAKTKLFEPWHFEYVGRR